MGPEDLELYCFDVAALNSKGNKSYGQKSKKKTRNKKNPKICAQF
jgi:hypothetical protein